MAEEAFVDLDWAEHQAGMLRGDLKLSQLEILNPYELAKEMGFIELLPIHTVRNILPEITEHLCTRDAGGWSAGSLAFPDGRVAVIMNPTHAKTRARATLMEEIAHIHLAHRPSLLAVGDNGLMTRSYNSQQEKEAYWVGAAALVTRWQLEKAQKMRLNLKQFADYCEVSVRLANFRSSITGIKLV